MKSREEESRPQGASARPPALQDRVAQLYYSHGLFCSTYPSSVIAVAISVALLCCYPLVNLPLPGNVPQQIWNSDTNTSVDETPWCYIQQVILRTGVVPWDPGLNLGDAFRAPLYEAFKLLDIVRNYQDPESSTTLGHVCFHVEAVKKTKDKRQNVFPQYSCLVLSPANLWHQDVQLFTQDSAILSTIFNHQNFQKGKMSIAEMLFGMRLSNTGIKRYPLRNRQRFLQYSITLFYKEYDKQFISGLRHKLQSIYPLHQNTNLTDLSSNIYNDTVRIYYPGEFNYSEFVPIVTSFVLLFLYYYFSVRKIELIKSKIGMAFTVVVTVFGSLTMTLGICFFFGLTLSLYDKEIFPYLIILVGLENVLVLTKSVVSTPPHLDVKIRIAQGLSKEGWSITKNLLLEITILTFGLFTFVPVIQKFCIFAIIGLLTDFFLQILFFSTILGIDTRRMENLVEKTNPNFRNNLYQTHAYYDKTINKTITKTGMNRSKSHPRLNSVHTDVVAAQSAQEKKIPKRLQLVNIWARTRFFQRALMIVMIVWISRILYNSGLIEHYFLDSMEKNASFDHDGNTINLLNHNVSTSTTKYGASSAIVNVNYVTQRTLDYTFQHNHTDEINKLKHTNFIPWLQLPMQHWSSIFGKYNISLSGQFVTILPSIKISHAVTPEQAILLRNSEEKYGQKFQWQALAAALDPIDFSDLDGSSATDFLQSERPYYPSSPMEILLTTILCTISVIVLAYALVVLYRCICTRNYAEWRASWSSEKAEESEVPVLLEAVPVVLEGHPQEIECIATDGLSIASSCLGGHIRVWDTATGELLANINRRLYLTSPNKSPDITTEYEENNHSDYESGSPPSRDETLSLFPSLQHKINTNFTGLKLRPITNGHDDKFDFGVDYKQLYQNHEKEQKLRHRNSDTVHWVRHQRQLSNYELQSSDLYETNERRYNHGCESSNKLECNYNLSSDRIHCNREFSGSTTGMNSVGHGTKPSPIWCMDYIDNLIVIGCANGHLEFWEGTTGKFKCLYDNDSNVGITSIKIIGSRVVAARLYGTLDFLQLQTYSQGRPIDWNFTCAYRRTHVRTASAGSISDYKNITQHDTIEDIRVIKVLSIKAHQQPITCLDSEGGRVLTGSQDHTLKVFRLEDGSPLYTLHGHYGPITCLFIDRVCPATSGTGSQDGMLCVWDLLTGACMYSIQAHDGSITSLTYCASYVISLGSDERLCVWERFQGHLLNTIQITHTFPSHVLMLTPHLVVTARAGGLVVWDVRSGESIRTIALGHSPYVFVKQMLMLRDAVLCDFGNQLRIVRFPLITHKFD